MASVTIESPLTDDEFSVLLIAAQGQWLAPIGRWEMPVKNLALRGLLFRRDDVNYGITHAGREATASHEAAVDRALGQVLEKVQGAPPLAKAVSDITEQAAHHLADAAKAAAVLEPVSSQAWLEAVHRRALELLR